MRSLTRITAAGLIALGIFATAAQAQSWEMDIYKIGERRRLAESKAAELKAKVKEPGKLTAVQKLYDAAMAKHNSWLDLEATAIKGKLKLDQPTLKAIAEDAAKAFVAYDAAANAILDPPTKEFVVTALPAGLVAEIVGELIKGGIEFWKAKKELDDARRKDAVDFLTNRAQWQPWTAIAACAAR